MSYDSRKKDILERLALTNDFEERMNIHQELIELDIEFGKIKPREDTDIECWGCGS